MEMEVMCDAFVNHRVKIKELLRMTVEFYISVRTFYMASMATLVAKVSLIATALTKRSISLNWAP